MRAWWSLFVLGACGFSAPNRGEGPIDASREIDAAIDAPPDSPPVDGPRTDWWDARWQHRRPIELDNNKVSAVLAGFPILVTLTPTTVSYANLRPNGDDLRFISEDNTLEYVYEIDTYIANGTSLVWVRIPTLMPSGPKPKLWLYYNNPTATPASSGAMLWGPTHVSVHHLGAALTDATNKPHTASAPPISTPAAMPGQIGQGRKFDGNDDHLVLAGEADYDFTTTMYASAWVQVTAFTTVFQAVITKGDTTWRMQRANGNPNMEFGTNSNPPLNLDGNDNVTTGWHHIAIVKDATKKYLYVDGDEDANIADTSLIPTSAAAVRFGMNPETTLGGERNWNGMIDEVRISATPRTAAWIDAEHMTVTDPMFVKIMAEEPY